MRVECTILAAGLWLAALPAWPHDISLEECAEGSDFIRNAALSRDNGLSRSEFIGRMHADIELIQAFPKELRWFVQDESDATLLLDHAAQVFDQPREAELHQAAFLQACVGRTANAAGASSESAEALLPAALHRAAPR